MTDQRKENIQQYRRQRLEPEIVAMSVELSEDENPTLIVNIDDPEAKSGVKKAIIWLGTIGGIFEWSRRSTKEQIALAVAGTAVVATAATAAITAMALDGSDADRPPVVAERVVTLPPDPPVTVTSSAEPSKTITRSEPPPRSGTPAREQPAHSTSIEQPDAGVAPIQARTPAPRPRRSREPPVQDAPPTMPPPAEADSPAPETTDPPPTRPAPQPEPDPIVAAAPSCAGVVEVDVDPLPDLCLLG